MGYRGFALPRARVARHFPAGIRARLFLLIGLTLAPILLLMIWIFWQRYQMRREEALAAELEVAQGVASTFESFVSDVRRTNYTIGAAIVTFNPYTQAKATAVLSAAAGQYRAMRNISWTDPSGKVLASSEPTLVGRSFSGREYLQRIIQGEPWAIGDLTREGTVTKAATMAISSALRDDRGRLIGMVVAGIEPGRLGEVTLTQRRPEGAAYAIFDRRGTLVYHNLLTRQSWDERRQWAGSDTLLQRTLATGQAAVGSVNLPMRGGVWLSARAPIREIGWVAGAGRPEGMAMGPVRMLMIRDMTIGSVVMAGAFVLAALIATSIARPLRELQSDARVMGSGGRAIPSNQMLLAPAEVRALRSTMAEMASSLIERAEAVRESEERYRGLFHNISEGFALGEARTGGDGRSREYRLVEMNDAFERQTGMTREILGRGLNKPETQIDPAWLDAFGAVVETGEPVRLESYHARTGRQFELFCYRPAPDRFAVLFNDTTERRRAEEALRQSEEKFRSVFEKASIGMGRVGFSDARWIDVNEAFCRMLGRTREEMRSTPWPQITHPDDVELDLGPFRRMAAGELESYHVEKRFIHKDGHHVWARLSLSAVRDAQGRPDYEIAIIEDITARKEAEAALRQAYDQLREADRRKDEFVAMLAHELRNPLAPVRNAVHILSLAGPSEPLLQRQRDIIDRQVTHMARLLDDLLDVSRITRGKITLKKEVVRLADVLARAVETAAPLIESHQHTLNIKMHSQDEKLFGDFDRLIQIIGNLLTNAAKYTDRGGRIWLETAREDGMIAIHVRDTGMGISPDLLPRVFDVFTQAERSLDRSQGGLGLGLSLVRSLTRMHGGNVEARSEGPGMGSEFIVRLPAHSG